MKAKVVVQRPLFRRVERKLDDYDKYNYTSVKVKNWRDKILTETRESMVAQKKLVEEIDGDLADIH